MAIVSEKTQQAAAEKLAEALDKMDGVESSVDVRTSGTQNRPIVNASVSPENWRKVAEDLKNKFEVDHCSMITGIHWPESSDKTWEVVYHFLRTGIKNPVIEGKDVPLEIQISVKIQETRTPSVASVQDIWVGADWNEKETWDLVGIDFDGHEGMRRVLNPHESPVGFHPLQKQHKLRYHGFEEMYDDAQGFMRKPVDSSRIK